ncbi:unnamed protein product [Staurois parvus]|uniref:Uncharacterized protein n=1 Tax=Staurois parvus TaxID=386267 RepID=A0ABN9GEK2_9NEOB|nr:unnamed protein product [Staurois parvus]
MACNWQAGWVDNNGTKRYRTVDRESQVTGRIQQRKVRSKENTESGLVTS